ncbi:MAG: hypothetical protein ACE5R4_03060, partial [Armatimonadota bacterium]
MRLSASGGGSPRLAVVALLAGVLSVALPASALSQGAAGIALHTRAGFRGHMRVRHWSPVHCLITNQSATPLRGELAVLVPTTHDRAQRYFVPLDLPTPAKQRFTLYVRPVPFVDSVTVEVRREGGELLASEVVPVRTLDVRDFVVATLSERDIGVRARDLQPLYEAIGRPIEAFRIEEADLPDRAQGYETLDLLIVDGLGLKRLSSDQREALRRWILSGGRLVIATGADWELVRDGGLANLLPVELVGSRVMALGARGFRFPGSTTARPRFAVPLFAESDEVVVCQASPRSDARAVAVAGDGLVLIAERRLGQGKVLYLAFDLHSRSVRTSPGRARYYRAVVDWAGENVGETDSRRPIVSQSLQSTVLQTPATRVPPLSLVALFLGIYLLVAGPLEYFALKRMRRLEFTWLTFPLLVAAFTFGAYRVAAGFKGGQVLVNEISVLWQRGDALRAETYFGLYSPRQAAYDIRVPEPSASLLALETRSEAAAAGVPAPGYPTSRPMSGGAVYRQLRIQAPQGPAYYVPGGEDFRGAADVPELAQPQGASELRGVTVNQWSMRTFRSTWWLPGQIESDLERSETDVRGTLT